MNPNLRVRLLARLSKLQRKVTKLVRVFNTLFGTLSICYLRNRYMSSKNCRATRSKYQQKFYTPLKSNTKFGKILPYEAVKF